MKFWITCRLWLSEPYYEIHVDKPMWDIEPELGSYWRSSRRISICEGMLKLWLGEDYDLPEIGECWEFKTEETIWIHTKQD